MSFIPLFILFVAIGVGFGILFNKLVIKNFPETGRKMNYVNTIIIFLLITLVLFAAIYGKFKCDSYINNYSNELEQDIIKNHSNLDFVKNGLDIAAVGNDISKLDKTINDLNIVIWPKISEFGVPKFLYDMIIGNVAKELHKKITGANAVINTSNPFVNEKNFLTVSSLISGLRITTLKIVKIVVFVIVVICVILLGIYILVSLSTAFKEKKRIKGKN